MASVALIAERFADEGATLVVPDRNCDRASKVAADIGHGAPRGHRSLADDAGYGGTCDQDREHAERYRGHARNPLGCCCPSGGSGD